MEALGELHPELWNNRQITTSPQEINSDFQGSGDYGRAWKIKPAGTKRFRDE